MSTDADSIQQAPTAGPVWLELFFDLVYVTAILLFSTVVSEQKDLAHIAILVGMFVAIWWIWFLTTLYTNRFQRTDTTHRLLVLAQMFFVTVFAMSAREGVQANGEWVSASYAILCALSAAMYLRERLEPGTQGAIARSRSARLAAAALIFGSAVFCTGALQSVLWILGLLVSVIPVRVGPDRIRDLTPLNYDHIAERMGTLTMIFFGESFVKVAAMVVQGTLSDIQIEALAFEFVLMFAFWWSYFDDIPRAGIETSRFLPWLGGHLGLQLGLAFVAIWVAKFVSVKGHASLPEEAIVPVSVAIAISISALALIGTCTHRHPRRGLLILRISVSAFVLIAGIAAFLHPSVSLLAGLLIMTAIVVGQAILADRALKKTSIVEDCSIQ